MRALRWILVILLLLLLVLTPTLSRWYTDWLWFVELGYTQVFWIPFLTRVAVTVGTGAFLFLLLSLNLTPLFRAFPPRSSIIEMFPTGRGVFEQKVRRIRPFLRMVAVGVVAFLGGLSVSGRWAMFQQFLHALPFGRKDPIFGLDLGFYFFRLPLYRFLVSWLTSWLLLMLVVVSVGYVLGLLPLLERRLWAIPRRIWNHLLALGGSILLLEGIRFWLDGYEILYSRRGAIFGATFTDLHATLPALRLLALFSAAAAILLFASIRLRTLRLALGVTSAFLVMWLVGLGVVPALVQQFQVAPNELTVEIPYIRNGIRATLWAFGLDRVRDRAFPVRDTLPEEALARNRETIENIRLWDYRPLLRAYNQLQSLRQYYVFADVDVDRYLLDGRIQQVMLGAREVDLRRLPEQARTWVNEHLVFTHGYGLVMNPVNRVTEEGMPHFLIQDIPPKAPPQLGIERPEIYYGELTDQYVVVNTRVSEFDYPLGQENVYTTYQGRGGIPLSNPWRKIAFAYRFGTIKLLFSEDITRQSRVLFARNIQERVRRIAPFLRYDRDPYLVLANGRLYWILDAYTTSDRAPYATPLEGINYIRNSVKAVIDAYNGTVDFYLVDPRDPVAGTYAKIFPGFFKPLDAMPEVLRQHLRYPVDLFTIQARIYLTFHMQDPRVFYNREDQWAIPTELFGNESVPVEPYYVVMKLEEGLPPEFVLILPFTPANKDNMVAWFAARSDPPHYGELLLYRFPKERVVYGPMQIESRINQDPIISEQLTLWNQQGSQVIRGNLLVIPIEDAILYVEPLFLQAERSQLPELKRVIVASGQRIVMEGNVEDALARIFQMPEAIQRARPQASQEQVGGTVRQLLQQAWEAYRRAQERLRQGDLQGYAREIEEVGQILERLSRQTRP
ncbi:MAG: UPF0182 family protein [Armatimonadota bacterium]|nr:UPF0182 family protein [Armatimonadota bacterium]